MRYYISDLHLFHKNIIRLDDRGFENLEQMHEYIIKQWNSKVRKHDEVVILGDFSYGTAVQTNEILKQLNGKLFLVKGNHDRFVGKNDYALQRFLWIKDYAQMSDDKRNVVVCHYPIMCYNMQYRRNADGICSTYMLYGHVHDTHDERLMEQFKKVTSMTKVINNRNPQGEQMPCQMINCYCKYSDYVPLTLDEWIEVERERMSNVPFPETNVFTEGNLFVSNGYTGDIEKEKKDERTDG